MTQGTRPNDPRANGVMRECEVCSTSFYARPSEDRRTQGGKRRFCSRACQLTTRRGPGNPKWRGGRVYSGTGYVYCYAPAHPHATQDGYVMEHRLVMEKKVGRYLDPVEQVHHINHVRDDNRPENLHLTADVSEHRRLHAYPQASTCAFCGTPVVTTAAHRRRWDRKFCSRKCAAAFASQRAAEKARER